ncbi:MAG: Asp23/Gls24 family envelope stress response protein [Clostridiaceae bacterium]|nr:Asp23/Gls24 family envelope stress response protein [Clostridiaceae bacterium]
MSESKKVKKPEAETEQPNMEAEKDGMGEIRISSDVVAIIASNAALEVPGIANFSGGIAGNISQVLGRKNPFKGIKVDITENRDVNIDLHIVVDYGVRIPDVAWKLQERIKQNVEQMTGLHVEEINVHVQGVNFEKGNKKAEAKADQETENGESSESNVE